LKKKISKKDIEDWNNFINKSEKIEDKDNQLNITLNQTSEKTLDPPKDVLFSPNKMVCSC